MKMRTTQYLRKGFNLGDIFNLLDDRRYLKETYYTEFPHSGSEARWSTYKHRQREP